MKNYFSKIMSFLWKNTNEENLNYKFVKCIAETSKINLDFSYINAVIDGTFDVFKSVKNEYLLIFSLVENQFKKYSLICYDLKFDQVNTKIAKAHDDRIYTIRHFFDKNKKNDLLLTSSFDKWIKIWNITNNFILVYKKKPDYENKLNTYLLSENLLYSNQKNYLITSAYEIGSNGYNILFYDYENNQNNNNNNSINNSQDNTNFLIVYYDKDIPYITAGNLGNVKVFDFVKKDLVKEYHDSHTKINYLSVIITQKKDDNNKILIASGADGILRIWDYNTQNILFKLSNANNNRWLVGMCLINEIFLFVGTYNSTIEEYNISSNKLVKTLNRMNDENYENLNNCYLTIKNIDVNGENYLIAHTKCGFIELWTKTN